MSSGGLSGVYLEGGWVKRKKENRRTQLLKITVQTSDKKKTGGDRVNSTRCGNLEAWAKRRTWAGEKKEKGNGGGGESDGLSKLSPGDLRSAASFYMVKNGAKEVRLGLNLHEGGGREG